MHAATLGTKVHRVLQQLGREDAVGDHLLVVVHVVDEHVERAQALQQTCFDVPPFVSRR